MYNADARERLFAITHRVNREALITSMGDAKQSAECNRAVG
jgi:hypothetical protein